MINIKKIWRRGRDSNPRGSKLPIRFRVGAVMTTSVPLQSVGIILSLIAVASLILFHNPGGTRLTSFADSGY